MGTWDGIVQFDIYGTTPNSGISLSHDPADHRAQIWGKGDTPLAITFGATTGGPSFENVRAIAASVVRYGCSVSNSTTNVWGATITGGGANKEYFSILQWKCLDGDGEMSSRAAINLSTRTIKVYASAYNATARAEIEEHLADTANPHGVPRRRSGSAQSITPATPQSRSQGRRLRH